jgi:hypothetical protein
MKNLLFLIIFLILVIGFLLISFLTNNNQENNLESKEIQNQAVEEALNFNSINTNKLAIFIDENANNAFDENEKLCETCIQKNLISSFSNSQKFPNYNNSILHQIGANGIINVDSPLSQNLFWGYFPDRDIFIKPLLLTESLEAETFYIPAFKVSHTLSLENSDFNNIEINNNNLTIYFVKLVPILRNAFNESKSVWVQFIPDISNPDFYYLTSAIITNSSESELINGTYKLEVNWDISEEITTVEKENYRFFMI